MQGLVGRERVFTSCLSCDRKFLGAPGAAGAPKAAGIPGPMLPS